MPICCLRWRPGTNRGVVVAAHSNGLIRHWHAGSGKTIHSLKEDNDTFCMD